MIALRLPSLADELERLPLRYSEPGVNRTRPAPAPAEFAPPVRDRGLAEGLPRPKDDPNLYARLYMRRRRAQRPS